MKRERTIVKLGLALSCLAFVLATWSGVASAGLPESAAIKLDPRLAAAAASGEPSSQLVWVTFTDKGELGPRDLAQLLADADAALAPRARARRERAHVSPLVDFLDVPVHAPYLDALRAAGLAPHGVSRWLNGAAVAADGPALLTLAAQPFVRRVEVLPELTRMSRFAPEPVSTARHPASALEVGAVNYGQTLSQLTQIGVPAVHDSGYVGTGVLICVLDEGFNYVDKHEALRNVVIPPGRQRDFVDGDGTVQDTTSGFGFQHGTWTLGLMAGNKPGTYVGAAFGAEFALARTENTFSETPIEMVNWGMGAEWADSLGADVISSSVGYFQFDNPANDYTYADMNGHKTIVSRAAEIAASKGLLVVNSVGNEGGNSWHFLIAPADVNGDSLIAVGAVDAGGIVAGFSSFGPSADGRVKPDLSARGVGNPLVSASGDPAAYTSANGTSFSCPLVAGLAACLLQARPSWTPSDVIRALRQTASRASSPDNHIGFGVPNGLATLRWDATAGVPVGGPGFVGLRLAGPNPLRSDGRALLVRFAIGDDGPITVPAKVRVFDAQGRVTTTLWSGELHRGQWLSTSWDGHGRDGAQLGSGVFFIVVEAGGHRSSARVVSLR